MSESEEQKIRDNIDLSSQFLDKENTFEQENENGCIGIYVDVNNCELFLYALFYPSDNSIVFDGKVFKLTEAEEGK